ncbi:MAG: cell division protein FtsH, partial [Thermodesulfovibrio sp.]|nr:cell division protein FtsH [Thermodesulfovibrio sp.]
WGMSDRMGPLTFGKREEHVFLGREIARHRDYSDKTAEEIDEETKRIVTEAYIQTKELLEENREILDAIAKALLERETLEGPEIEEIILKHKTLHEAQVS